MKVNVLKMEEKELKLEIQEEGHSLLNALQKVLLRNQSVELAGYDAPHPLVNASVLYVRTKGSEKPVSAIVEAAKELSSEAEGFWKAFQEALKEYNKSRK